MLARPLARAALCGPIIGTPRHDRDGGIDPHRARIFCATWFFEPCEWRSCPSLGLGRHPRPKALAEGESRSAPRPARSGRQCINLRSSGRRGRARHPRTVRAAAARPRHDEPPQTAFADPTSKNKNSLQRRRGRVYAPHAAFWWDFVVGDHWRLAAGLLIALALLAFLAHSDLPAWWLMPVAVLLAGSLRQAARERP